jgi:hypothetical protein
MLSVSQAEAWVRDNWADDAFCCVSIRVYGSRAWFVKGAFTISRALEIINDVNVDSYIDDVVVSTPDENTSWFTRLDSKDIDGNKLKLCHRCSNRFAGGSCPEH